MGEIYQMLLGLLAGNVMGLVFFGGLWITVRAVARSHRPMVVMVGSFLFRMTLLAVCFYVLARGTEWIGLLTGLLGIMMARALFVVSARPDGHHRTCSSRGIS